jgi:hypothetical protein
MKKIRGDKPIGVIIHIYVEVSQRHTLCSYLYLKQAKMSFFFIFSFFFYKIGEQEGRTSPAQGGGPPSERGKVDKKVNTVQKINVYTCM